MGLMTTLGVNYPEVAEAGFFTLWPRMVLNLRFCLSFPSARITNVGHHAQQE